MFDALKKSMIDAIEEGPAQTGLSRRDDSAVLSAGIPLCVDRKKAGRGADDARTGSLFYERRSRAWKNRNQPQRRPLLPGRRPKGAAWVHAHTNPNGFLAAFIAAIGRHGCTMDELLAVFNRYGDRVHVEELHNGEFDWLISFEDGQPDAYRYCIADEGCHLTYHRFTKEDYEAFGF